MKDQNVSIYELDAIKAIIDVIGKCYNTYKHISNANNISAIQEMYKAYRWLQSCESLIFPKVDENENFYNTTVNAFSLEKHGILDRNRGKGIVIFAYKELCLNLNSSVSAIYEIENSSTLNKSLYLDYLYSARVAITHARYIIEFEMEYLFNN